MIKVYKLKIGEKVYEVEVESITEKEGSIAVAASSAAPVQQTPVPAAPAVPVASAAAGGSPVEAPMQGVVIDILVSVGQEVSAGDELLILEAMKMENPIVAPTSGKVASIHVSKGENVDTGKVLISLA